MSNLLPLEDGRSLVVGGGRTHAEVAKFSTRDAERLDAIWFDDDRRDRLAAYLASAGKAVQHVLEAASAIVDGFESPLGLELLATIDWLMARRGIAPAVPELMTGIAAWPSGPSAARRKARLFDERLVGIALQRLSAVGLIADGAPA